MAMHHDAPREPLPVIGLLGAPGSGKSTIAGHFADLGCAVIDADQLAREAFADPAVAREVARWWGDGVLDGGGQLDRAAIAKVVFNNPDERARLERLIHPEVNRRRQAIHAAIRRGEHAPNAVAVVEDCPLLLEAGLEEGCDARVFVDCPLEERRRRVLESRGWSAEELAAREAAQIPLDTKRRAADYTIDNTGSVSAIRDRVADVLASIQSAFAR